MAAQGTKSQQELAVQYVGAIILILFAPYAGVPVISLGTVWIPPTWFTPSQFDGCLNWTVHVSVAPLICLPPQDLALAVPTRADEVLYGQRLMPLLFFERS